MEALTALLAAIGSLAIGGLSGTNTPAKVLKASEDPFYSEAPANLASLSPGDLISVRLIEHPLVNLTNVSKGYNLRFRSTNSQGNPIMAVTTLVEPAHLVNGSRAVSFQWWENSAQIDCAPSYKLVSYGIDSLYPQMILDQGWNLIVTDHAGPNSVFGSGELGAHITLDSIRAVQQSKLIGNSDGSFEAAIWGYSGGSLPTAWAAQLQPEYAPELEDTLLAAAFGGVQSNLTMMIDDLGTSKNGPGAGHGPVFAFGLEHEYPVWAEMLAEEWNASTRERFSATFKLCNSQNKAEFANESFYGHFKHGSAFWDRPAIRKLFDEHLNLGEHVPQVPMFLYQSANDTVTMTEPLNKVVGKWCAGGAPVARYIIDENETHDSIMPKLSPEILAWFKDRFERKELESVCDKKSGQAVLGLDL